MLRVANLCAELTSRCNILIAFWHNASKALHQRNTEPTREKAMFSELLNKINIQIPRCKENFKLFLSILAARHCLILNDLIVMVVKTCVKTCLSRYHARSMSKLCSTRAERLSRLSHHTVFVHERAQASHLPQVNL